MVYVFVFGLVMPPILAVFFGNRWREQRRRTKRGWTDEGDPMSWRDPKDALILVAAGVSLAVGATCIFAIRSTAS